MKRFKTVGEWVMIGSAIAIVASIISIITYREVINSDWYIEWKAKKSFSEICDAVNDADSIAYIKIQDNGDDRDIYDIPSELFDDIECHDYTEINDFEKRIEIFNEPCLVVFFKDGSYISFSLCENGDIYWDTIKINCPSIAEWYNDNK